MRSRPTFEQSRAAALRLLGDAAGELRAGDWSPMPNAAQRDAVRRAFEAISAAKAALDQAARAADRGEAR